MQILFEMAVTLALLLANGVLAMSEIAIVAARPSRLERRAGAGDARARLAWALKREPTEFLSAVQVGITLVGILAGAFGGTRLARHLALPLSRIEWLAPHAETVAFVLVVGAITYLSLIIGELVPKRIALADPEKVAARVAIPMRWIARLAHPVVVLLSASTNAVVRFLRIRASDVPEVTEEDIRALIAQGARSGVVHETEEDILERVFYIGDRQVRAVMTPRPDVEWLDMTATPEAIRTQLARTGHARLLLCDGGLDRVRGVVRTTDLLVQRLSGNALDLTALLREPHYVPASMPLLRLLQQFRLSDMHLAVALDEYGALQGIVTLNDILADLVADVPGLARGRESDVVLRDDGSWLVDGTVPLDEVERVIGSPVFSPDDRRSKTLGGLMLAAVGRLPREGDRIALGSFSFEVMDMDGRRVDRVLVRATESPKRTQPPPS